MHGLGIRSLTIAVLFGLMWPAQPALAKSPAIYAGLFSNVAVSGYDAVAYFTEGKAVEGSGKFKTNYKGAVWRFSSEANKNLFVDNTDKYAPQYGGYCAYAIAKNDTNSADPKYWKIVDGKLYLFHDAETMKKWDRDYPDYIRKADKNWPAALN